MADFCKTCKHCYIGEYDEPCFSCRNTGGGIPTKWEAKVNCKPQTNADRIRATDDELATMLHAVKLGYRPWCDYHCENEGDDGCDNCIKEWLKQPAEE